MNELFDLIRKLFYLRTCNYNLSEENILDKNLKSVWSIISAIAKVPVKSRDGRRV